MVIYKAENIETGEVISGDAKTLAKKIGVARMSILNAVSKKQRVRRMWYITNDNTAYKSRYSVPMSTQEDWDMITAPYKELIAQRNNRRNKISRTRLRTMYNVGKY